MAYTSRGRKPMERASKIAHAEIIQNPDVQLYLKACTVPSAAASRDLSGLLHSLPSASTDHVKAVIAIDGGFTETYVREDFPSASITFFTFGPLLFKLEDLRRLDHQRFIAPEDLAALRKLQRFTLVLPTRGVRLSGEASFVATVRRTIYDFFSTDRDGEKSPLMETLRWFLFRGWQVPPDGTRRETLESCPNQSCDATNLSFTHGGTTLFSCPSCGQSLFITDVFRLHERVDEEQGAGGVQMYVMTLLEQMVLIHMIRKVWELKRTLLREILFIKDGPLAFFGVVSPLRKPMQELAAFLLDQPAVSGSGREAYLHLLGAEKSGEFVDHAIAIESHLPDDHLLIPDNAYIYRYIVPGDPSTSVYGHNTYYGQKVIFKSRRTGTYVLTIPTSIYSASPGPTDFPNLGVILQLVAELRCNMYDNALVPIALANMLVSLSDLPSQRILTEFARGGVS